MWIKHIIRMTLMALIVYVTDACRQETKNHGLQDVLEKVKLQLEDI